MAEKIYYVRLNTDAGVTGKTTLTGTPKGDVTLTPESPVCPVPLPESYVRRAKLQRDTFLIHAAVNRPGHSVPRFLFALSPFPEPKKVVEADEEIPVEDEIPVVSNAADPEADAAAQPKVGSRKARSTEG
jgi:hypothetical protein